MASVRSPGQVNVLTQHNDIGRTGQNTSESLLTPANVNSSQFGLLFALPLDGNVYAQPLYLSGVKIPGAGTHNVVFVATEHDSVYAFDADSNGGGNASPLWQASLSSTAHGAAPGATSVSSLEICEDIVPEYGITGTPTIDPVAGVLYVVSFTKENGSYILRLHALSVTTGAEMLGGPVTIQAQISGVGNGSSGGVLHFDSKWENQRPGLLLLNGVLYIGFASHADNGDWHGWVLSYNATTLTQLGVFCASPNGVGSGFWMGGDGLAADVVDPVGHPFGRMFLSTGNGDYSASTPYSGSMDYGDSILRLDLNNGVPTIQDEYTPSDQASLDLTDGDLGSGGVLVLPDQSGANTHLMVQEGKSGLISVINRDQLGGYSTTADNIVQEIGSATFQNGVWGGPAYWNGTLYTGEVRNPLKARPVVGGVLSATASSASPDTYAFPNPSPSISALGNANGILWAVEDDNYDTGGPAILKAYDATNLASELYTSSQVPARDTAGTATKFVVPTIANGKVYVSTGGQLDIYGLFSSEPLAAAPVISPGSTTFTSPVQVSIADATPGASIYYTLDGSAPSTASTLYTGPFTVNSTLTVTAIAVAPGYVWIAPVSATYTSLNNTANPMFSPAGGTFSSSPTVTLADASPNAVIYYTTNGSTPTTASTVYAAPIKVTGSETISAIAFAPNLAGSTIISQTYTTQSSVDFSEGFSQSQSIMTFNGSTGLDDSRLQLTNGYTNDTGSAFMTAPINIQAFTTDFTFQLSNPQADGITFTIQNQGPTALAIVTRGGILGAGLGYQGISDSLAIKFDFHNDAGEGHDSTGVYVNGAPPTVPAIDLTKSSISLLSGDSMGVHLTYDGANLAMTLTDQVTNATWSGVWQVNIPQIVGGNTAYLGFTGSTQVLTASQKIATWTYKATTPGQASNTATPVISPAPGSYSSAQTVTIGDSTANANIYYTTDGTAPATTSNLYTGAFTASSSETVQAIAVVPGGAVSAAASATFAIAPGVASAGPNYTAATGFSYGTLILNGPVLVANPNGTNLATAAPKALQLTDGGSNETRSAYFANPVNIQKFTTDFDFQLQSALDEGFTFVVQSQGLNAIGGAGSGLGYGVGSAGTGPSIGNSVAVKFDFNSNNGEGSDSTGVYVNGASPTVPATALSAAGLQLNSGHKIHAHLVYDGTNLNLTLTDSVNGAVATASYPVNIPATVGGNTAYIGFTSATSANSAVQDILDWTFGNFTVVTATPAISPGTGSLTTPTTATIADSTPGAAIYYTTDGSIPTAASTVYTGQGIPIDATGTIQAIAQAPGDGPSAIATATLTIQTPAISFSTGFSNPGLSLNGGATVSGRVLQITDGGINETRSAYFSTPLNVQAFTTDFDFQLLNAISDGCTFVIQNQGLTALGTAGGGLGYGLSPTGGGNGINNSVAIKFDFHNNSGEGTNSTGLYLNGVSPTLPATNLTGSGIQLNSGDTIHAHIVYNGTNLTLTLTDATANATVTEVYPVNIPATVGGNTAYFGFTGGTGGSSAVQNILDWTYTATSAAATATPVISPGTGTYMATTPVTITDSTAGAVIYYTTSGSTPTANSPVYTGQFQVSSTATVQAVALAPSSSLSAMASAMLTIQSATATPVISPASGTYSAPAIATIADATAGAVVYYTTDGSTPNSSSSVYAGPIPVNANETIEAIAVAGSASSPVASSSFTIQSPNVAYQTGFISSGMTLNGGTAISSGGVLQLTDGGANEARSAFLNTPVNIQAFITDFDFQLLHATGDGFTFTVQNQGLSAVGANGGGLGYGVAPTGAGRSIATSVAVKFDIHSNSGEGNDSTGLYLNGASPTMPATNLTGTGLQLSSGDKIHAHIVYDGTNLTLTLTDSTANTTATAVYAVNIPSAVGGNTAYIGFTGGTGGTSSIQNILDWSFNSVARSTASPSFSLSPGTYVGTQTVSLTDVTPGATIYYYTATGLSPKVYTGPISLTSTTTLQTFATSPNLPTSLVNAASYTIQPAVPTFGAGLQAPTMTLNGGASIANGVLQLTDGHANETRSAFFDTAVNVQAFTTDFDFQLLNATADGFTFTIQNQGLNALGNSGSGLGYGLAATGTGNFIGSSVAVKFDIHSNSGEGNDSTGIYLNGASPTIPSTNLTGTGIALNSGDKIHAHIVYNGTNLTLTLTDSTVSPAATVTEIYPVNIPSVVGGNTAFVGFTGGAGGTSSIQNILDWTLTNP